MVIIICPNKKEVKEMTWRKEKGKFILFVLGEKEGIFDTVEEALARVKEMVEEDGYDEYDFFLIHGQILELSIEEEETIQVTVTIRS